MFPAALFTLVPSDACVLPYGSRVYGTAGESSDYDFSVVHAAFTGEQERLVGSINAHLYAPETFQAKLDAHDVVAVECWFGPGRIDGTTLSFLLDKQKLRSSFSHKANHAWVKAKKKLTVERDFYVGRKSLWHSLRILKFGIQIATEGRIVDFSAANDLYEPIVLSGVEDWTVFKDRYQTLSNTLNTEFRKVAPK